MSAKCIVYFQIAAILCSLLAGVDVGLDRHQLSEQLRNKIFQFEFLFYALHEVRKMK